MFTYFKSSPNRAFIKIDYYVINNGLSEDAELLYVRMSKVPQGKLLTIEDAVKLFKMSRKRLIKARKELKDLNLLATKQLTKNHYMQFLGNSSKTASECMEEYFESVYEKEKVEGNDL